MLPRYIDLHSRGELVTRARAAAELLADCGLCPRQCGVNRLENEEGVCRTGSMAKVASYAPHFGEESPLVGSGGSGTIFFSNCNLLCVFCQNYEISHLGEGTAVTPEQLAAMMQELQQRGCHNINFVTPSHVVPQILAALVIAADRGLNLPLVYNSSGYDLETTLKLLDGVVDIYMPDFKFWDAASAARLAKAKDYPTRARAAIKEMHRQVGDLIINDKGVAERGLLVRHLVMPGGLTETGHILHFLAEEISKDTYVNVMDQYRPCGLAHKYPPLDRRTRHDEYQAAMKLAEEAGLKRLDSKDWQRIFRILDLF
jgi:putative pyruvate formate lyase activating enzyme